MAFGLWDSPMPSTPEPRHLKRQRSGLRTAVRTMLSTPDTPSSSMSSASSCEWESDVSSLSTTPDTTPSSTPESHRSPKPARIRQRSSASDLSERLSLDLIFSNTPSAEVRPDDVDQCSPPAFYPCSRVAFSPKLKIEGKPGLKVESSLVASAATRLAAVTRDQFEDAEELEEEHLCGMSLSVAGVVETLENGKNTAPPLVKSTRVIADFCTDLTSGIKIWQRDAALVIQRKKDKGRSRSSRDPARLPAGSYCLPLSMKIPGSEQLPPSYECPYFRIRYTMSLVLLCKRPSSAAKPRILKLVQLPFQILPSTMPSLPPVLPVLTHSSPLGFGATAANLFSSVAKLVASDALKETSAEWQVQTCLPTSSYSPSDVVPVSLRIRPPVSEEVSPGFQQIFVRLTLVCRTYVRDSWQTFEQELNRGLGLEFAPDESAWNRCLKEETELCQKWGVLSLPASAPASKGQATLTNLPLPLSSLLGEQAGCSASLDLPPGSGKPSLSPSSTSSWFSPAIISALDPSNSKAWDRYLHVSSRFYVAVEIGFFSPSAPATRSSDFKIYSSPSPFAERPTAKATSNKPQFPGKLRELLVPITIGSVAEPALACLSETSSSASEWAGEARSASTPGDDHTEPAVEGIAADCWVVPPPTYEQSFSSPRVSVH